MPRHPFGWDLPPGVTQRMIEDKVERDEDIDNNEPGDLSPEDEKLADAFPGTTFIGKFVNVYLIDRAYGGPEEGGWWYKCGSFVRGQQVHDDEEAERVKATLQAWCDEENSQRRSDIGSVLSEGRYDVYIEDEPGESFPEVRPHYE